MWLRSEKKDRHTLNGRDCIKKHVIKRNDILTNPQSDKAVKENAGFSSGLVIDKTSCLRNGSSQHKDSLTMKTRTNGIRGATIKRPEKSTPLKPKGIYANIENKKVIKKPNTNACKDFETRSLYPKIVNGNTPNGIKMPFRNGVMCKTNRTCAYSTNRSLSDVKTINNNNNSSTIKSEVLRKNVTTCLVSPRKSRRLEKCERSNIVNGSPSRKVRQLPPKRVLSQSISAPPAKSRIISKRNSSCSETVKVTNENVTISIEPKSVEVPTVELAANDWVSIVDHDMTMYEREIGKLSELDLLTSEESDSDVNDNNLCMQTDRLDQFMTIDNETDFRTTEIKRDYSRSIDKNGINTRCRKISTHIQKAKRRTFSTEAAGSMRRTSCDISEETMDIRLSFEITTEDIHNMIPTLNEMECMVAKTKMNRLQESDNDDQEMRTSMQEEDSAQLANLLQGLEQPDLVSMLAAEEGDCSMLGSSESGDDDSQRTAIERLEALSDLQLQPTSFLADISQSLAAADHQWVSIFIKLNIFQSSLLLNI